MDYTKQDLFEQAMGRMEALDDALQHANAFITAAYPERRVIRNLLYLAFEKKSKIEETT